MGLRKFDAFEGIEAGDVTYPYNAHRCFAGANLWVGSIRGKYQICHIAMFRR